MRHITILDKGCLHTSFDGVRFGVVSDEGRLGLRDLHQAVFVDLGQGQVLFIPLQAAVRRVRN